MTYENPSVVAFGSAASLVQHVDVKGSGILQDSGIPWQYDQTPAAYQADE